MEHASDETCSDDISSECDNSRDTVQVAAPREARTDGGTVQYIYSYLNCLNLAAVNVCFPGQTSNMGSQNISQVTPFPGRPWPLAVLAVAAGANLHPSAFGS